MCVVYSQSHGTATGIGVEGDANMTVITILVVSTVKKSITWQ